MLRKTVAAARNACGCTRVYFVAHSLGALLVSRLIVDEFGPDERRPRATHPEPSLGGVVQGAVLITPAFDIDLGWFSWLSPNEILGGRFLRDLEADIKARRRSSPGLSSFLREHVLLVFGMKDKLVVSQGKRHLLQKGGESATYQVTEGHPIPTGRVLYVPGVMTFWVPGFDHWDIVKIDRKDHPTLLLVSTILRDGVAEFRRAVLSFLAEFLREATKHFGWEKSYVRVLDHVIEEGIVARFHADSEEAYERDMALAREEIAKGNHETAETALRSAIREAEKFGLLDLRLRHSLVGLAELLGRQGREAEAHDVMQRADEVLHLAQPAALRLGPAEAASYVQRWARQLREAGRFLEASQFETRALRMRDSKESFLVPFQVHLSVQAIGPGTEELPGPRMSLPPGMLFAIPGEVAQSVRTPEAKRTIRNPLFSVRTGLQIPPAEVRELIAGLQEILVFSRQIGDPRIEGVALGNLGVAHVQLGQPAKGVEYLQQALEVGRRTGDRERVAKSLGDLGSAHALLGEIGKAIGYFEQAVEAYRELGDRRSVANTLGNLALAYARQGRRVKTIEYLHQALRTAQEIGDPANEARTLSNLAAAVDDESEAIDYSRRALAIHRAIGDRQGEGNDLTNLGAAHLRLGQTEEAIKHLEQALAIRRQLDDRLLEANDLINLGLAHARASHAEQAIVFFERGLALSQEIGDRPSQAGALSGLGAAYLELGQAEKAIDYLERALVIDYEIGDLENQGRDSSNLGEAYLRLGDVRKAAGYLEDALKIARTLGNPGIEARALKLLEEFAEYR